MCRLCERVWPMKWEWRNKHIYSFGYKVCFKYNRRTKIAKMGYEDREKLTKRYDHNCDRWTSKIKCLNHDNPFNFWGRDRWSGLKFTTEES